MNTEKISTPVAIVIAAIALILFIGIGFWYMNRPTGPTAAESRSYVNADLAKQGAPPQGSPAPANGTK